MNHPPKDAFSKRLRDLYAEEDGGMPNLQNIHRHKTRGWLLAVVVMVFVGLATMATWLGYLLFGAFSEKTAPKLLVQIEAPATLQSYAPVTMTVRYENLEAQPLTRSQLQLVLPDEFVLTGTEPVATSMPSTWALGTLDPRERGEIALQGYFIGEQGAPVVLQAKTDFRPANFNADFQDVMSRSFLLGESALRLQLDAPTEVVAGEQFSFTYRIKNEGGTDVKGAKLSLNLPPSLRLISSVPAGETLTPTTVPLPDIKKGAEAQVTVKGVFSGDSVVADTISGALDVFPTPEAVTMATVASPIRIAASTLELRTLVNGSSEQQTVGFGGTLRLSSMWKNSGEKAFLNNTLRITVNATPDALIDWKAFDTATDADKTFKREGETIILNPRLWKTLASLAPDAEGSVSYALPLSANLPAGTSDASITITSSLEATTIQGSTVGKKTETTPFTIAVNSDAAVDSKVLYFTDEDVAIGSGPLPPKVGETTSYTVFWTITNSLHELRDAKMKAQLPNNVRWTGKSLAEAGVVRFDEVSREVIWELGRMPTTLKKITVQFEVAVLPTAEQVNAFAPLTTKAVFSATDAVTSAYLTDETLPESTEAPGDAKLRDKGLVRP